jgi:cation:H+ antiporter
VLFILGLSALITPLVVNAQLIRQEVPIMVGASVLLASLVPDHSIGRVDAAVLFGLLIVYTVFLVVQSRKETRATKEEYEGEVDRLSRGRWDDHWAVQGGLVIVGLALLVAGSDWLVGAAVAFARAFGVSDLVIGLTIVAAGTSMPEVATSVTAAFKGERDIAVGNVVGSNTFNILGCLGLTGLVASGGIPVAPAVLNFDLWVMLAVAIACLPVFFTGREIARWEGGVFLGYYVAYAAYLVLSAQQHDLLPAFSAAMLWFAIPLTMITLAVVLVRSLRGTGTNS